MREPLTTKIVLEKTADLEDIHVLFQGLLSSCGINQGWEVKEWGEMCQRHEDSAGCLWRSDVQRDDCRY